MTRLRYLGDIAMSTVVLAALRRGDPDVELGFLCEEDFAALLAVHPDVQRLHLLRTRRGGADARARTRATFETGGAMGAFAVVVALRRARYDLAVDLFFNPRSAWLLRLAGIPRRIGGTTGSRRSCTRTLPSRHRPVAQRDLRASRREASATTSRASRRCDINLAVCPSWPGSRTPSRPGNCDRA